MNYELPTIRASFSVCSCRGIGEKSTPVTQIGMEYWNGNDRGFVGGTLRGNFGFEGSSLDRAKVDSALWTTDRENRPTNSGTVRYSGPPRQDPTLTP
jgi:hypothetical protein